MSFTTSASAPDVSFSRFVSVSGTPPHGPRTHRVNVEAARRDATPVWVSDTPSLREAESPAPRFPNEHVAGTDAKTPPADGRRSTETAGAAMRPWFATVSVYVAVAPSSYAWASDSTFTETSVPHARQRPRTFFSASCCVATYVGSRVKTEPQTSAVAAPSATSTRPRSDAPGRRTYASSCRARFRTRVVPSPMSVMRFRPVAARTRASEAAAWHAPAAGAEM